MIEITSRQTIYFSQIIIDRYQGGYDTNCFDYNKGQFTSRHDCLVNCLYHLNNGSFKNSLTTFKIEKHNLDNFILARIENIDYRCKIKCKIECKSAYYGFDQVDRMGAQVFSAEDNNDIIESYAKNIPFFIFLRHSSSPDLVVHHYPEMTLLSLMCNFGGLLGMWTGLSVLIICRKTFKHLSNVIDNFKPYLIKVKNKLTFNSVSIIYKPKVIRNHHYYYNWHINNR